LGTDAGEQFAGEGAGRVHPGGFTGSEEKDAKEQRQLE